MEILFFCLVPNVDLYSSLADEFAINGHRVTFVTPTEDKTCFDVLGKHRVLYFHAGKMLNVSTPRKGINNLLFSTYCSRIVKKHIKPQDYNLLLMSTPPLGFLSSIKWIKKANPGIKFYLLLRDIHPEGATHILKKVPGLYGYFKKQAQSLYNLSDVVGCMSPYNVKLIQDKYLYENRDKVKLLPNWGRKVEYKAPSEDIF